MVTRTNQYLPRVCRACGGTFRSMEAEPRCPGCGGETTAPRKAHEHAAFGPVAEPVAPKDRK